MIGNSSADIQRNEHGTPLDPHQRGLWLTSQFEMISASTSNP
jgi:hypothetical protein